MSKPKTKAKTKADYFVILTVDIDLERLTEKQVQTQVARLNRDIETIDKLERYLTRILPSNVSASFAKFDKQSITKINN